jgi:hypothetical protein
LASFEAHAEALRIIAIGGLLATQWFWRVP